MANDKIIPIDSLEELVTAGENDYLLISHGNDTYKIKASAVGGGGGGADDFLVEFAITPPGEDWVVVSETTFAQILAAYQQGKNIRAIGKITGMFDFLLYPVQISDAGVVFFGFIEAEGPGTGINLTISGNSSGYSMYVYQ